MCTCDLVFGSLTSVLPPPPPPAAALSLSNKASKTKVRYLVAGDRWCTAIAWTQQGSWGTVFQGQEHPHHRLNWLSWKEYASRLLDLAQYN